jgi:hypothetical protein
MRHHRGRLVPARAMLPALVVTSLAGGLRVAWTLNDPGDARSIFELAATRTLAGCGRTPL